MVNQAVLASSPSLLPPESLIPPPPAPLPEAPVAPPDPEPLPASADVINELPAFISQPVSSEAETSGTAPAAVGAGPVGGISWAAAAEPEVDALGIGDAGIDDETVVVRRSNEPLPQFTLEFTTGQSFVVTGTAIAGRNPRPRPGEVFDETLVLIDPTKSVSKTHLEFSIVDGQLYASDRESANGTELLRGDTSTLLPPGEWAELLPGDVLVLGDQQVTVS